MRLIGGGVTQQARRLAILDQRTSCHEFHGLVDDFEKLVRPIVALLA